MLVMILWYLGVLRKLGLEWGEMSFYAEIRIRKELHTTGQHNEDEGEVKTRWQKHKRELN